MAQPESQPGSDPESTPASVPDDADVDWRRKLLDRLRG